MDSYPIIAYLVILTAFIGIAAGRLPRLTMNRPSIALAAAVLLILAGGIGEREAFAAIDAETIALLLAMMILVANLRISGFFDLAGARILRLARSPRSFLAIVIFASGLLSALFLNDTICIMLTPLVAEICRRTGRDGRPYLIGLATAANAGSCATSIGNPQNMLIASQSGIPFLDFIFYLGPPSLLAMGFCYLAVTWTFGVEFGKSAGGSFGERAGILLHAPALPAPGTQHATPDRHGMVKSLIAAGLLLLLLMLGVRTSVAALAAAAFLMVSRRIHPEKVFAEVDFSLLVFFAGLFILTGAVAQTPLFIRLMAGILPRLTRPGAFFAAAVTFASNVVSNVPAVMLLSPIVRGFQNPKAAWLMLAMASTFAGNLTLLGSVANLIVAGIGEKSGIKVGFLDYLKVGVPVTIASVAAGTAWLAFVS
jgi:Na+/H+ antiporter NhaD/arsenite permease-like protein